MRRALCVGIDNYSSAPLTGCVNDAEGMRNILSRNQDSTPNFDCAIITAPCGGSDKAVTRPKLREEVEKLFKDPADLALFYFSGHGTFNNLDGYLVTQDAKQYDEGVSMGDVLKFANSSKAHEIVILLDCCFSGKLGNTPAIDNSKALLREGISILTASRAEQVSVEVGGGGIFTSLVIDALNGGAADILGMVTAPAVYSYVEAALGAWDQRPLFKSHVAKLVPLRRCEPPIERKVLQKIPKYFPLPAEDFQLDPTYEPKSSNPDPIKTAVFLDLQRLSKIHLVMPVGVLHMYEAAMGSNSCRLTPSGRYYWRLATTGRI